MMTRTNLVAYGLPGLPLAALGLPLYIYLPNYYAEQLGLGLATVGGILLAARLFDMVSDPLAGVISDAWKLNPYRRKSMMVAGVPLLLLGSWYLLIPGAAVNSGYLLTWSLVTYLGWTLIALPYTAWGAELSADYHERSRITACREAFVIVGTLCAAALPALFSETDAIQRTLQTLAGALWLVLPLAVLAALVCVPERRAMSSAASRTLSPGQGLRLLFDNRPFLRLMVAYVLNGIANGLPATLFVLFVGSVLQVSQWIGPLLVIYFAAGVISLPGWLWLSRRWGKHRAWSASMLWACAVFIWVPLLGPGDLAAFVIICVLSGLSLGVDLALPAAMQADIVDLDTLNGGGERAGLYFGLWSMATKLALALAVGIAFPLLEFSGFNTGGESSASALLTLGLLYGVAPVVIKLIAVALVWRFPLDQVRQQQNTLAIDAARRAAA